MAPELVTERRSHYMEYMVMMMKQEMIMREKNSEILGVAKTLVDHQDVQVRLMIDWLADAVVMAKDGDLLRVRSLLRLASACESNVSLESK
jgi:hypothetical protein